MPVHRCSLKKNISINLYSSLTLIFILLLSSFIYAKPNIELSGDIGSRLRYNYLIEKDIENNDSSRTPDFQYKYSWNFRTAIEVNEFLKFGFRISNPTGYSADYVTDNINNKEFLSVPEAYFKWMPAKVLALSVGIIPVVGNTVLDLAATSQTGYDAVADDTWRKLRNNSEIGLNFLLSLIEGDGVNFGVDFVAALAQDAEGSNSYDAFVKDKFEFILSAPIEFKSTSLKLLPTGHFLVNNFTNVDGKEASHAVEGGMDIAWSGNKLFGITVGAAGGLLNNDALKEDSNYISSAPLGVLLRTKLSLKPKYGTVGAEFRFGRYRDRNAITVSDNDLLYFDFKYKMPVKNISIIPRMRLWYYSNSTTPQTAIQLRPALLLKASF